MELTTINLPPSVTSVLEVKSSYDCNYKSLPSDYKLWNGPLHAKLLVFHEPTTLQRTKHRSLTNSPQTELSKVEGTFLAETVARKTYIHSSYSCHNSIFANPQWMSFSLCEPTNFPKNRNRCFSNTPGTRQFRKMIHNTSPIMRRSIFCRCSLGRPTMQDGIASTVTQNSWKCSWR